MEIVYILQLVDYLRSFFKFLIEVCIEESIQIISVWLNEFLNLLIYRWFLTLFFPLEFV